MTVDEIIKYIAMNFKTLYKNSTVDEKLKFLEEIIRHNEELQQAFVNFSKVENSPDKDISPKLFLEKIEKTREQYLNYFESVDTENPDWDSYKPSYSGYIEEWEQYQEASEQEIEQFFREFKTEAVDKIIQQKPEYFTAMLIGLYEACLDAEIDDPVESFGDVNKFLVEEHTATMATLIDKINLSAVSGNSIRTAMELFFYYCDEEYPGNQSFPNYFQPVLLALAEKSKQPDELLAIIDKSKVNREAVPQLVLLLNKNAGNNTEWLHSAQQFYLTDNEVAKDLLNYYFENDMPAFVRTAKELFEKDKRYWAKILADKMDINIDKELYINVFYQLTLNEQKIDYYRKIKSLLDSEDLKKLIQEVKYNEVFVVKIYEENKDFEKIKTLVQQHPDSWHFAELITPILNIYPDFCFKLIEDKATGAIQSGERGRSLYQRIAAWLTLAKTIPGHQAATQALCIKLYNHKPNLPALRDEFRKAGVM